MLFAKSNAIAQNLPLEAKQIIQKTILFKKINKPNNYEFTTYNKLIVTANAEAITGHIDSIFTIKKGKRVFKKIDSSDYNFKKIITKQHLYQTEKISKFQVQNNQQKEKILATKMAGFKEPIFEYFALQLQPFSVYDSYFSLVEKEYINPISDKGIQKYKFTFLENTFLENRKVYKIEFEPIKKSNTDQLKGVFYIDVVNFSIAKAELKVFGLIEVKCNYVFEFNKEIQNWFPIKTPKCICTFLP